MPLEKMGDFSFSHAKQQDDLYRAMTAEQVKAAFDSRGDELKEAINKLIEQMQSVREGDSGAKNVKATPLLGIEGNDVQAILEGLKGRIDTTVLGQIPNGTITKEKLAFNVATEEEFRSHDEDDVRHITADERTTWNGKINASEKGSPNGIASLGEDGKLSLSQRPVIRQEDIVYQPGNYVMESFGLSYIMTTTIQELNFKRRFRNSGIIRVSFELSNALSGQISTVQIYKNGQPYGVQRNNNNVVSVQYTEDLEFHKGDIFSMFGSSSHLGNGSQYPQIKNLKFMTRELLESV